MTRVKVLARQHSVTGGVGAPTQVKVKLGQILVIATEPTDTWVAGPGKRTSGPNGLGNPLGADFGLYAKGDFKFPFGSLVGSLDKGKTFFAVGSYLAMTVLTPGPLTLHFWDENHSDNSGHIVATVQVFDGPR